MEQKELLDLFTKTGAIRQGHFYRLSGRHTDWYVQCARLFEDPETAALLGNELAAGSGKVKAGVVLAAAVGGASATISAAHATAPQLAPSNASRPMPMRSVTARFPRRARPADTG